MMDVRTLLDYLLAFLVVGGIVTVAVIDRTVRLIDARIAELRANEHTTRP